MPSWPGRAFKKWEAPTSGNSPMLHSGIAKTLLQPAETSSQVGFLQVMTASCPFLRSILWLRRVSRTAEEEAASPLSCNSECTVNGEASPTTHRDAIHQGYVGLLEAAHGVVELILVPEEAASLWNCHVHAFEQQS